MRIPSLVFSFVFASILFSCDYDPIVDNPSCEEFDALRITRIETSDTATVISAAVVGFPKNTFSLDRDSIFLEESGKGRGYILRGVEGIEFNRDYTLGNTGVKFFKLIFYPVEKKVRSLDLVTGSDDRLNVRGISLIVPDSVKSLPVCHVSGELKDMPDTKALMLSRWLDYEGNIRNLSANARLIEVKDGRFEFDIPVKAKDDYYTLIPWNEFIVNSFHYTDFFAEEGDVQIEWQYGRLATIHGGELNKKAMSLKYADREINDRYGPVLDSFYMSGTELSAKAEAIIEKADAETDYDKRIKLYNRFNDMPDQERYSEEFYEVYSRRNNEFKRASDSLYEVMSADVSLGYMPKLLYDVRWSADDKLNRETARIYAERFADYGLGRRLESYLEAIRTDVGGEYVDFEAPDRQGEMHRFSEMIAGSKIVLLDLWASWCSPCRNMAKSNKPIYDAYRDKGFTVVSVAREFKNTDALDAAVEKDGYKWPVLVELDDRINLWRSYNAGDGGGLLVVIDPATGKILSRNPSTEELEEIVKEYCQ